MQRYLHYLLVDYVPASQVKHMLNVLHCDRDKTTLWLPLTRIPFVELLISPIIHIMIDIIANECRHNHRRIIVVEIVMFGLLNVNAHILRNGLLTPTTVSTQHCLTTKITCYLGLWRYDDDYNETHILGKWGS